ncbi:hypothetical protein D9611_015079 [Ephemerocybe angulata]|uniref:Mannose-P-dolichol utilization defect 1 protein n=1 Tax=Ephemerocybe angulata TaxID=980116 RepID=A0A8H5EZR6_9AGAR|nr:hypothetical protein D9611_015079 [Tulosesus angulatus]
MRYRRLWESELWSILLIINARGPSLPSYVLETLSYAITLAYSVWNAFPFSTYGENLFLALQITIITFLIILYSPIPNKLNVISKDTLALPLATLPLSLISKFPQIRQNAHAQSTGQLSAFAVVPQVLGCLARVFTAQEVGDPLVQSSLLLALILNTVLAAQMYMYWGKHEERKVLGRLGRGSVRSRIPSEKREHLEDCMSRLRVVLGPHLRGRVLRQAGSGVGRSIRVPRVLEGGVWRYTVVLCGASFSAPFIIDPARRGTKMEEDARPMGDLEQDIACAVRIPMSTRQFRTLSFHSFPQPSSSAVLLYSRMFFHRNNPVASSALCNLRSYMCKPPPTVPDSSFVISPASQAPLVGFISIMSGQYRRLTSSKVSELGSSKLTLTTSIGG